MISPRVATAIPIGVIALLAIKGHLYLRNRGVYIRLSWYNWWRQKRISR